MVNRGFASSLGLHMVAPWPLFPIFFLLLLSLLLLLLLLLCHSVDRDQLTWRPHMCLLAQSLDLLNGGGPFLAMCGAPVIARNEPSISLPSLPCLHGISPIAGHRWALRPCVATTLLLAPPPLLAPSPPDLLVDVNVLLPFSPAWIWLK